MPSFSPEASATRFGRATTLRMERQLHYRSAARRAYRAAESCAAGRAVGARHAPTPTTRAPLRVAALQLDHYGTITDSIGHGACDEWLRSVAARIRRLLEPEDMLARVGRDLLYPAEVEGRGDAAAVVPLASSSSRSSVAPCTWRARICSPPCRSDHDERRAPTSSPTSICAMLGVAMIARASSAAGDTRSSMRRCTRARSRAVQLEAELRRGSSEGSFCFTTSPSCGSSRARSRGSRRCCGGSIPTRGLLRAGRVPGTRREQWAHERHLRLRAARGTASAPRVARRRCRRSAVFVNVICHRASWRCPS